LRVEVEVVVEVGIGVIGVGAIGVIGVVVGVAVGANKMIFKVHNTNVCSKSWSRNDVDRYNKSWSQSKSWNESWSRSGRCSWSIGWSWSWSRSGRYRWSYSRSEIK
jgi:hypothetical protein